MRKVYLDALDAEKLDRLIDRVLVAMGKITIEEVKVELELAGRYDLYVAIRSAIQREYHKARRHVIEDDEYWNSKRRNTI